MDGNLARAPLSLDGMLSFHLGPLSRRGRMWLQLAAGCLGASVLLGPALLALGQVPPIAAPTSRPPLRLVSVKPFNDLTAGACFPVPPVYAGPTAVHGRLTGQPDIQRRLTRAVLACADGGWTGDVTIAATVDARGNVTDVLSQGTVSAAVRSCLTAHVLDGDPIATRGPGTLKAGYWLASDVVTR